MWHCNCQCLRSRVDEDWRLIIEKVDVLKVCKAARKATIIANHMDAVNHATVIQTEFRDFLNEQDVAECCITPKNGETLDFY